MSRRCSKAATLGLADLMCQPVCDREIRRASNSGQLCIDIAAAVPCAGLASGSGTGARRGDRSQRLDEGRGGRGEQAVCHAGRRDAAHGGRGSRGQQADAGTDAPRGRGEDDAGVGAAVTMA